MSPAIHPDAFGRGPGVLATMVPELMGMHDTPAREFVKKSTVRPTGYFASRKSQAMVQFESMLERDFLALAEVMPDVVSVASQPVTLAYRLDGRRRFYTPDFLVKTKRRCIVVEVKPASKLGEVWHLKEQIFRRHFMSQGRDYRIITEEWIRREPRRSNVRLLTAQRQRNVPSEFLLQVNSKLAGGQETTLAALLDDLADAAARDDARRWIYALMHRGVIGVDLDAPLSDDASVTLCKAGSLA